MTDPADPRRRAIWLLPPIAIGVLVLYVMVSGKQPPTRAVRSERVHAVRVVEARSVELTPVAEGYGTVQPERVWAAVAQVSGRVVERNPRLRNGEILPAGTLLFRIDPVDYELSLAQAKAELAELEVGVANTRSSLAIQRRDLGLAKREMERIERLAKTGTASGSDVDSAERTVLAARIAVQNSENTLALIPAQQRLQTAKITQAERDLSNTSVSAPFNLRVAELVIEKDQYVSIGQVLFKGDAVDRVEIVAQIALSAIRKLFIGRAAQLPDIARLQSELREFTGFRPRISMDMGNAVAHWDAEFVRFSDEVDPHTRTLGIVVAVDAPLRKAIPGQRPPLSKGMFVQVTVRGHLQRDRLVIPRIAIRNGHVYVVNEQSRLEVRPVSVLFHQGAISVIGAGVEAGEQIVVTDPVPAVPGMLLSLHSDDDLQRSLISAARGER